MGDKQCNILSLPKIYQRSNKMISDTIIRTNIRQLLHSGDKSKVLLIDREWWLPAIWRAYFTNPVIKCYRGNTLNITNWVSKFFRCWVENWGGWRADEIQRHGRKN
ncbi:unnamed protein product [Schistosoma margrebowiei]|uniref:Uncharacterized protein n=1 Tax=Schistosoma margrebowiei TaxID=48269 RepID=A0A3P8BSP1_9TREM|nr:unnamed protein product [Schistosoma margrebowiei]